MGENQELPRVKVAKKGVIIPMYERPEVSVNFKTRPINKYRSMDDTNG